MDGNLLQYGALGAFTAVVLLFLRSMGAERRDRRKEREVFMEIITNHVDRDREAKTELGQAIGKLCECLKARPCLAIRAKNRRTVEQPGFDPDESGTSGFAQGLRRDKTLGRPFGAKNRRSEESLLGQKKA